MNNWENGILSNLKYLLTAMFFVRSIYAIYSFITSVMSWVTIGFIPMVLPAGQHARFAFRRSWKLKTEELFFFFLFFSISNSKIDYETIKKNALSTPKLRLHPGRTFCLRGGRKTIPKFKPRREKVETFAFYRCLMIPPPLFANFSLYTFYF